MIIRQATIEDVPAMLAILNRIIEIGGTTAYQDPVTEEKFIASYLTAPPAICCFLAEDDQGVIGFQVLGTDRKLPDDWAEIGTFVTPDRQRTGAGAALFAATTGLARAQGYVAINATIRADNVPGLGYYTRRGFVDYAADPEFRLKDGTRVGRVHRRFDLGPVPGQE